MGNPFTPSFGKVPAVMAGRGPLIDELADAYRNEPGDPNWTTILVGARGTGKTAMLACLAARAEQECWIAARVTAVEGMLQDIYEQTLRKSAHLLDAAPSRTISGLTVAGIGGIQLSSSPMPEMNWRSRMTDVLEGLNARGVGLLIEVDEVDPALAEMTQLVTVYQHFVTEDRRVALLMAGLPHRVSRLLNGASVSFLRRASQQRMGPVADYEVAEALRQTAEEAGKSFDGEALDRAVSAVGGFPYLLQLVGYRSWNATGARSVIDAEAVEQGTHLAACDMRSRVLRPALDELSEGDLAFLRAMLEDEGCTTTADLSARLGRSSSYVSTYKKRLLEQGIIEEAGRAKVRFALPLARDFLPEYLAEAF